MEKRAGREQMNVNLSSLPPAAVCTLPRRQEGGCTICWGQTVWKNAGRETDGKFSSLALLVLYGKWKSVIELLIEHETTGSLRGCFYANRSAGLSRTLSVQHIHCLKYSAHTLLALWLLMGNTFIGRLSFLSSHKNTKRTWHHSIMGVNSQM